MNHSTYQYLYKDVIDALHNKRLQSALQSLQGLAATLKSWSVKEEIDTLLDSYQILLGYMAKGANDPERSKMYKGFTKRAFELAEVLNRIGLLNNQESIYTSSLQTLYKLYGQHFSLCDLLTPEAPSRDMFDAIWLSGAWTVDDEIAIANFMADDEKNENDKCLLLSATTLAALQFFDIAKYRVLLDNTMSQSTKIRVRALTGFIFIHIVYNDRIQLYADVNARLKLMSDIPNFVRELEDLQKQLFLSLETKRIEHNLQNEIIPQMMKRMENMRLDRSLGLDGINDKLSEIDLNPEWDENGKPSKLNDYMHEFVELQQRGADMYMGSFKIMKQRFPFFNTISNWFWPFTINHPDIPAASRNNTLVRMITNNIGLCDSDKYSFCLMAAQIPESENKNQFQDKLLSQMQEMEIGQPTNTVPTFKEELRSYVQGFYRFCNLYRFHEQFINPFQHNLFIVESVPFNQLLNDHEFLLRMAEFTFNDKSYALAVSIYKQLPNEVLTSDILQKYGFCHEQNKNIQEALTCYQRANLLKPHSTWTLHRMAICYRATEAYEQALHCYNELAEYQPEDAHIALRQAECLIHLKRHDEALKFLFKANYLNPDSHAAERALAWCSLLIGKYDQAEKYYNKVLSDTPTATDYLNAGHAAWLQGNIPLAIARYRKSISSDSSETFLNEDKKLLLSAGKNLDDIAMMTDAVLSHQ